MRHQKGPLINRMMCVPCEKIRREHVSVCGIALEVEVRFGSKSGSQVLQNEVMKFQMKLSIQMQWIPKDVYTSGTSDFNQRKGPPKMVESCKRRSEKDYGNWNLYMVSSNFIKLYSINRNLVMAIPIAWWNCINQKNFWESPRPELVDQFRLPFSSTTILPFQAVKSTKKRV